MVFPILSRPGCPDRNLVHLCITYALNSNGTLSASTSHAMSVRCSKTSPRTLPCQSDAFGGERQNAHHLYGGTSKTTKHAGNAAMLVQSFP